MWVSGQIIDHFHCTRAGPEVDFVWPCADGQLELVQVCETLATPETHGRKVECWAYDPVLLGDGKTVDPLSLILSLADSADERVQKALREVEASVW